jgi:hypothetical protein
MTDCLCVIGQADFGVHYRESLLIAHRTCRGRGSQGGLGHQRTSRRKGPKYDSARNGADDDTRPHVCCEIDSRRPGAVYFSQTPANPEMRHNELMCELGNGGRAHMLPGDEGFW